MDKEGAASPKTAPYEVASNVRALAVGKYLYLDGKKYLRPILTPEEVNDIAQDIEKRLTTN